MAKDLAKNCQNLDKSGHSDLAWQREVGTSLPREDSVRQKKNYYLYQTGYLNYLDRYLVGAVLQTFFNFKINVHRTCTVWTEKNCQMSIKVAQKWCH